jgi:hypothetical protein
VREAAPEQVRGAARVLDRLPPARWTLEWFLPWWLGDTFAWTATSPTTSCSQPVRLAFVRIHDDLVDGELGADPDGDVAADGMRRGCRAEALAALMYDEAIARTGAGSVRCRRCGTLERYVAEWRSTTLTAGRRATGPSPATDPMSSACDARRAAEDRRLRRVRARGTLGRFAEIERALDHALTALVAYDHLCDWEADIAAGRWNAFVAANSTLRQPAENADRLRAAMFVTLLTGDAVAAWSARIAGELAAAIAAVDRLASRAWTSTCATTPREPRSRVPC